MSQRFFLAAILVAATSPVWADDLKPGQWEITMSMEGAHLPGELTAERTQTACMTQDEAADMVATMSERWEESGCTDLDIAREGDTISAEGSCENGGRTTTTVAQATLKNDEHYTSEVTLTNDATTTIHSRGRWLSAECESDAG